MVSGSQCNTHDLGQNIFDGGKAAGGNPELELCIKHRFWGSAYATTESSCKSKLKTRMGNSNFQLKECISIGTTKVPPRPQYYPQDKFQSPAANQGE